MTKNYWVAGHPLRFCLTTPVLNGAFEATGWDGRFETHDVSPEERTDLMEQLKSGDLDAVILTLPHKTPTVADLPNPSDDVKWIGAVNLVRRSADGSLEGFNTDWTGAKGALSTVLPDFKDHHILILGAGGAARAAAYAAVQGGAKVSIWNRTPIHAQNFAAAHDLEFVQDMREWDGQPDVIINATALSDEPRQSSLVPFPLWAKVQVAVDAVYGKTSLFLEEAQAAQVPHRISGETWFLMQAFEVFERLTGQPAPKELMQKLTEEAKEIMRA